jgi:integrase
MNTNTDCIKLSEHLKAKKKPNGIWYLTMPAATTGKSKTVSTGLKGSATELRRFVKKHKIKEAAEVAAHTRSARAILDVMMTGRQLDWETLINEWEQSMIGNGKAPSTIERSLDNMRLFIRQANLKGRSPRNITEKDITDWINGPSHISYLTRCLYLQAPRSFFAFTQSNGYTIHNPAAMVRVSKRNLTHAQKEPRRQNAFTGEQFAQLAAKIRTEIQNLEADLQNNPYTGSRKVSRRRNLNRRIDWLRFWYSAIHMAYAFGLRISDICLLEWASLSDPNYLVVHTAKTEARVAIPIRPKAIKEFVASQPKERRVMVQSALKQIEPFAKEAIDSLKHISDTDIVYVFATQQEQYDKSKSKISLYFSRLLESFNFSSTLSFHSLRHARIREWDANGLSLDLIGKFVGHASEDTTTGYL